MIRCQPVSLLVPHHMIRCQPVILLAANRMIRCQPVSLLVPNHMIRCQAVNLLVPHHITFARASLAASASAAIALWSCTGKRTSLLQDKSKVNPVSFYI